MTINEPKYKLCNSEYATTNFPSPNCTATMILEDNSSSLRTGWQVLAAWTSWKHTMARRKQKYGMILLPNNRIVAILLILFVNALPLSIMMTAASVPSQQKSVHIAVTIEVVVAWHRYDRGISEATVVGILNPFWQGQSSKMWHHMCRLRKLHSERKSARSIHRRASIFGSLAQHIDYTCSRRNFG